MKLRKKITAIFMGLALLAVVAGFCDSLITSVSAKSSMMPMINSIQNMHYAPGLQSALDAAKNNPLGANSLSPCCSDKNNVTPASETSSFNAGIKLAALGNVADLEKQNASFGNNLQEYSDTSPPKPDVLSSVLRLE